MPIHIVSQGETAASIAAAYGVSLSRLIYDNQLNDQIHLVTGQALLILYPQIVHTLVPGDTLSSIAAAYETTPMALLRNNPFLSLQPFLIAGETIVIQYQEVPESPAEVDGYAYPYINLELLQQTLPYLSALSIFSYGFTPEGELIGIEDEPLLSMAREFGVKPVLVLTPFSSAGVFDNNLVTAIVNDLPAQNRLIQNLITVSLEKGYGEVDIDFEYIRAEDKDGYVNFVTNARQQLNAYGIQVSVALAPKVSADQPGLLYEGIDYRRLGEAANTVLLMTYEWGYTYGPPMAVAPIPSVRRVLDYAVTEIPPEKISMGIPNYGYDWPLPFVRGETKARSIGNQEAVSIAAENNAQIQYDTYSQAPFFEYQKDGISHIVWFEDVRSIQAKFGLITEYGFRGMDYWQLMRPFLQNWLLLNTKFIIV